MRSNDPDRLRELILKAQRKAGERVAEAALEAGKEVSKLSDAQRMGLLQPRVRFMIEAIYDLKNNKKR